MNRLAIGEEHDAEEAPLLLGNLGPAPQASVRLDDFPDRRIDGALDPLIQNADARWEWYPNAGEVLSVAIFAKNCFSPSSARIGSK